MQLELKLALKAPLSCDLIIDHPEPFVVTSQGMPILLDFNLMAWEVHGLEIMLWLSDPNLELAASSLGMNRKLTEKELLKKLVMGTWEPSEIHAVTEHKELLTKDIDVVLVTTRIEDRKITIPTKRKGAL